MRDLSKNSECPGQDFNRESIAYKSRTLSLLHPDRLGQCRCFIVKWVVALLRDTIAGLTLSEAFRCIVFVSLLSVGPTTIFRLSVDLSLLYSTDIRIYLYI
jgi:hypothetical protein